MEAIQEKAREARIDALLIDLATTDDSAEAARKARELRMLVENEDLPSEELMLPDVSSSERDRLVEEFFLGERQKRRDAWWMFLGFLWPVSLLAAGVIFNPPGHRSGLTGLEVSPPWLMVVWVVSIALMVRMGVATIRTARTTRSFDQKVSRWKTASPQTTQHEASQN